MRDWVERMEAAGARVLNGEGLICQEVPNDDAIAECKALGKQLAALIDKFSLVFLSKLYYHVSMFKIFLRKGGFKNGL